MASFKSTILTQKAHALMAKLTSGTATSTFTKIKSSEYDYSALTSTQLEALTSIEDVKQEVLVSEVTKINEASVKVSATLVNTELTTGYYIKTIALYANDPDEGEILYSVTTATESDWMPPYNSISSASALFDLITTVSNAENVSIDVDPNAVATITQLNDVKDYVICNKALVSINHGLSGYPRVNLTYTEYGAGVGGAGLFPAGANSECNSLQNRAVYTDNNNLTIYVPSNYYFENASVNKINDYKYIVTFGNNTKSILISLIKENIEEEIESKADNTDNSRTTTDKTVTGAINELDANVNQLSNPNLLINGDFQVWQRGTSFTFANGYTADRWLLASISNISISKIDTGGLRLTNSTACTSNCRFHQYIEVPKSLQGKTVTLSVSMKSSVSGKVAALSIASYDRATLYGTKVISLTTNPTVYSVTVKLPVGQDIIFVGLALSTDSSAYLGLTSPTEFPVCTIDIDWFKLEQVSIVTPFVSRAYAEELALCQRYYQPLYVPQTVRSVDNNQLVIEGKLICPMRTDPTVSYGSTLYMHSADTSTTVVTLCSNISSPEVAITYGVTGLARQGIMCLAFAPTVAQGTLWTLNSASEQANRISNIAWFILDAEIY